MREHCSLVARSVLSLSSSLVHGGLELSIMNSSCHATSRPRSKYSPPGWNIIDQVETATFLERFITNMQRERSEVNHHHHPWFQSFELFQGRLPYFHQWHKDAGAESHTKIQNYRWRYVSICKICHKVVAFSIDITDTEKWSLSITAFEKMVWPTIKQSENTEMFKSKLRYQATFYITNENRLFCKIKWDDILVELYCRA